VRVHLGIDDTDSLAGGCTTRIATDLVLSLVGEGATFLDYPNLVRLNPNVPWKTRGNGAVCLRFETDIHHGKILESAMKEIERSSRLGDPDTDPAVVLLEGRIRANVIEFGREALARVVTPTEAVSVIRDIGGEAIAYGSLQGIVGALAAIGNMLTDDHTFELIAYRSKHHLGKPRLIDPESVLRMSGETKDSTFNNVDPETGRVLITPRGPDPILCGVRGESPDAVRRAFKMLSFWEPFDAWMIFRTNQGTDAHLVRNLTISEIEDHSAVVVKGTVRDKPYTINGGHVIFTIEDQTGFVHCAAYEPSGRFRDTVKRLKVGDGVRVFGGVRAAGNGIPRTINLEKLEVVSLAARVALQNPICERCGKRMKSAGKNQGFRCKRCETHQHLKIRTQLPVDLEEKIYLPPPRAHRHLTKPEVRYGRERSGNGSSPTSDWHYP